MQHRGCCIGNGCAVNNGEPVLVDLAGPTFVVVAA
jgi:hypothetical protein